MKKVKKSAHKKVASPKKNSNLISRFLALVSIFSVFLIAVAFVTGAYYSAHPESHVLGASSQSKELAMLYVDGGGTFTNAIPTAVPASGGQIAVNFVKYDTTKKGWVYAAVSKPTEVTLISSKNKTIEVGHVVKNSQGYAFKAAPLGSYSVRFNSSVGLSAATCTSSCFSIPTTGYSKTNPVKVTLTSNGQLVNIYLQLK